MKTSRSRFLRLVACGVLGVTRGFPAGVPGGKGRWFPSEMRKYKESITGHEVWQLTNSPYDDVNLYFTEQSFTQGSGGLVFYSNRTGKSELYYWS